MSSRSIRWIVIPALAIGMVLCSIGCAQVVPDETPAAAATTAQSQATPAVEQAREAAQMAVSMEKDPGRVAEILETHHMTRTAYEDLLFKIALDPELSHAYEAARKS